MIKEIIKPGTCNLCKNNTFTEIGNTGGEAYLEGKTDVGIFCMKVIFKTRGLSETIYEEL